MAGMFNFHTREAVRVKVKKCEGHIQPEYRKFSVDPQITSFEVMQSLLARAFDIKGEFNISYLARDDTGQEIYFSLLSDWDLDAAFLAASQPCLRLKVDVKPFDESLEEWDIITPVDFPAKQQQNVTLKDKAAFAGGLLNKMGEKTLNLVQKALNLVENQSLIPQQIKPLKLPMSDAEFHNYLDSDGRLVKPVDLRLSIYRGGLESCLRKVVWKHILNVYPDGLSASERVDYMKRLSKEYYNLRETWQKAATMVGASEEMQTVTNLVRKDVLRTDRSHKFYAGLDDNKNIVSLFSILTTYALNHPSVSYCQGMSDLASPLLVTMKDEAHAYVCFCAVMKRLKANFLLDGRAMTIKFQHLTDVLQIYDPDFYSYLQVTTREYFQFLYTKFKVRPENDVFYLLSSLGADDLLFCYRWLLLELKREFAFDDALRMLEVLWSSLPHNPPEADLEMCEVKFELPKPPPPESPIPANLPSTISPPNPSVHSSTSPRPKMRNKSENPYTKVRAMRRQSSGSSCSSLNSVSAYDKQERTRGGHSQRPTRPTKQASFQEGDTPNEVLPDYLPMSTAVSRELRMEMEVLDRELGGRGRTVSLDDYPIGGSEQDDQGTTTSSSSTAAISDNEDEEHITKINSSRRSRKKQQNKVRESKESYKSNEDTFMVNGEIIENDDDDEDVVFDASAPDVIHRFRNPHLKKVVPINVVREKTPKVSASLSSPTSEDELEAGIAEKDDCSILQNPSAPVPGEGYGTCDEAFCFTLSMDGTVNSFNDSGVVPLRRDKQQNDSLPVSAEAHPMTNSCEEVTEYSSSTFVSPPKAPPLPPPSELGGGNPFMIFLCLAILLQHRDHVMKSRMDYNETAMHFDRMVRRHNVNQVLHQARLMFADYMKGRNWQNNSDELGCSSTDSSSSSESHNRFGESFERV